MRSTHDIAHRIRFFIAALMTLTMILAPTLGTTDNQTTKANARTDAELLEIIRDRQVLYEATFPEIKFVVFTDGEAWLNDIITLAAMLGFEPSNLDYEHPPALRQTLMEVSIERIILMTRRKTASATLFKADKSLESRGNICVLTLNPTTLASSDATATRHLLDIGDFDSSKIPTPQILDRRDYLRYRRAAAEAVRLLSAANTPMIEAIPEAPLDTVLVKKLVEQASSYR